MFSARQLSILAIVSVFFLPIPQCVSAGDWPTWRYDAQRSAASPASLADQLQVHWTRQLPPLTPGWSDQEKMQFDAVYEPIVAGQRLIIGSSHDGSVTAYDTRTGQEQWVFFAEGPVRFAPLASQDNVYFVSDDGYLYCVALDDGRLRWRFRGGPSDRKILGNERMISTWPARGAPVLVDGKIYFAAGIWPFMGIFLHALDAQTGEVLWTNDGDGTIYIKQPHNADSFAGVAPQGALVAVGDRLLIPGGRSVPACYDRLTGRMIYYQLAENAKKGGGSTVAVTEQLIFNGGAAFDLATEKHLGTVGEHLAFTADRLYHGFGSSLRESDLTTAGQQSEKGVDRKGLPSLLSRWSLPDVGTAKASTIGRVIKAGDRLYVGSEGVVQAFDLPLGKDEASSPSREWSLEGTVGSLIAADDRLFAVTREGRLFCLGNAQELPASVAHHSLPAETLRGDESDRQRAAELLAATKADEGYALLSGTFTPGFLGELLRASKLRLVVLDPDPQSTQRLRTAVRSAGLGGDRIMLLTGSPHNTDLPPYFASVAWMSNVPESSADRARYLQEVCESLRPFGGVACAAEKSLDMPQLPGLVRSAAQDLTLFTREGPLPGSADWTHEHADAANTRVSKDQLVKAPLGLLWFGGASNDAILPRHGHGPQPQVLDGRLYIEGMDILRAIDIYTGRLLWEASLPGIGELYNNTAHQPGANGSGTNYISTRDGIYVAYKNACVRLDPATGKQLGQFQLPIDDGKAEPPLWGYINVAGDYLVGGADPLFNSGLASSRGANDNYSFSRRLVVMDRRSGKVLWTVAARNGFRHNAICIGGDRLYCIDRMSGPELARLKRRGEEAPNPPRLIVFELATGKELWSTDKDVFGTWLSYSAERDILVESGRVASDTIMDEPKGMRAYLAVNGKPLWENKSYAGPAMLHHDTILMAGKACDLVTGALKMREHPLSGEPVEWTWSRNYGCNTPMASEHLLTFRSGAAGYLDYCNDGGTGNFGGFRSSCSNNLIVAGGLLTAPDYTRTCVCSYQNQTSLALVPMPEVETWTSFDAKTPSEPVRRVGINLNAPGDRKADDGTLWLEFPSVGGTSPDVKVTFEPQSVNWFRRHSSQVSGNELPWVAASGAEGLSSLKVELGDAASKARKYTVRLHFMEPDEVQPGERVFQVLVQGKQAVTDLDLVKETGGRNRPLVKEITGVEVQGELVVQFVPQTDAGSDSGSESSSHSKIPGAVLCGVEVQAEGW